MKLKKSIPIVIEVATKTHCHWDCQWLNGEWGNCLLFGGEIIERTDDQNMLRCPACLAAFGDGTVQDDGEMTFAKCDAALASLHDKLQTVIDKTIHRDFDALKSLTRRVEVLENSRSCISCNGRGLTRVFGGGIGRCESCNGTGRVEVTK